MFYNRILRAWVLDPLDYFLLSAILGSIVASRLKSYLLEKKAMERLKNSIIKKSESIIESDRPISNSKYIKIRKIYRLALNSRGGQLEDFLASNEVLELAKGIKGLIERLAIFLKQRELKGIARIFFKNGRLLLELILYKCKIDITYSVLNELLTEGLSTQVIVITATSGGAAGFAISWFSAGATLVVPPVLISVLLLRSVNQQLLNQRDYSQFKKMVDKMLNDDELKETIRAFFIEGEPPTTSGIEMKPWNSEKNPISEFNSDSNQTLDEFIKAKIKEELGLVENPTPEQIQEIVQSRKNRPRGKPKGKTVYFKDLIDQVAEDPSDIIDAEIVKETIKVKNEEL